MTQPSTTKGLKKCGNCNKIKYPKNYFIKKRRILCPECYRKQFSKDTYIEKMKQYEQLLIKVYAPNPHPKEKIEFFMNLL